jgi:hypothetical protein
MFTEVYWYNHIPYTWGVSIYDDWYYYGPVVSRYAWRSGFGGSYWWGYDPWWDYNPWMGFGWSSWYSPGVSYNVNFYLGRPYYHYPMAWSRWHHYRDWNYSRQVYIINNNNYNYYYGSTARNSHSSNSTFYNPSHPNEAGRRTGYTVTNGRSSARQNLSPPANTGTSQSGNNKEKSNNGLRMGQYRRGTVQPSEPKPNEPDRPNNPNVNDRLNPGREKTDATGNTNVTRGSSQTGTISQTRRSGQTNTGIEGKSNIDKAPVRSDQPRQTQNNVRTTKQKRQTVVRQTTTSESKAKPTASTVKQSTRRSSVKSSESGSSKKESKSESQKKAGTSGSRQ